MPEENFWTLWCKGRLTEAETQTIRLGATPSGLTSAHLHHSPIVTKYKHRPVAQAEFMQLDASQSSSRKGLSFVHDFYNWSGTDRLTYEPGSFLLPNQNQCQSTEGNTKHIPRPVAWPTPFFIHQWPHLIPTSCTTRFLAEWVLLPLCRSSKQYQYQ